jgi:hypothetical protein
VTHSNNTGANQMKKFKLDGLTGYIDQNNFIRWSTISCHFESLSDCPLKKAAAKAK